MGEGRGMGFGRLGAPPPCPPAGCRAPCTPGRVLRTRLTGTPQGRRPCRMSIELRRARGMVCRIRMGQGAFRGERG